jgi:hypothetical protein
MEEHATMKGWRAHRDGLPRTTNSIITKAAFEHGYDCRATGDVIPWALVQKFRERQTRETGVTCYEDPTKEQADALA